MLESLTYHGDRLHGLIGLASVSISLNAAVLSLFLCSLAGPRPYDGGTTHTVLRGMSVILLNCIAVLLSLHLPGLAPMAAAVVAAGVHLKQAHSEGSRWLHERLIAITIPTVIATVIAVCIVSGHSPLTYCIFACLAAVVHIQRMRYMHRNIMNNYDMLRDRLMRYETERHLAEVSPPAVELKTRATLKKVS